MRNSRPINYSGHAQAYSHFPSRRSSQRRDTRPMVPVSTHSHSDISACSLPFQPVPKTALWFCIFPLNTFPVTCLVLLGRRITGFPFSESLTTCTSSVFDFCSSRSLTLAALTAARRTPYQLASSPRCYRLVTVQIGGIQRIVC